MKTTPSPDVTTEKLTNLKFVNIFKTSIPSKGCAAYLYAERLGVNSVAFICFDPKHPDVDKYLLNSEFTPPLDCFHVRAFGGSLDKDKTPRQIVVDEVNEEVGFTVTENDVYPLGKVFVSTQMNQYCYLFAVQVDFTKQRERHPENKIEELAQPVRMSEESIFNGDDWKSITILIKMRQGQQNC